MATLDQRTMDVLRKLIAEMMRTMENRSLMPGDHKRELGRQKRMLGLTREVAAETLQCRQIGSSNFYIGLTSDNCLLIVRSLGEYVWSVNLDDKVLDDLLPEVIPTLHAFCGSDYPLSRFRSDAQGILRLTRGDTTILKQSNLLDTL